MSIKVSMLICTYGEYVSLLTGIVTPAQFTHFLMLYESTGGALKSLLASIFCAFVGISLVLIRKSTFGIWLSFHRIQSQLFEVKIPKFGETPAELSARRMAGE